MSYNNANGEEKERGRAGDGGDAAQEPDTGSAQGDSAEGSGGPVGKGEGFVYFIETEDRQYVKIGYSNSPVRRISQIGLQMPGNRTLHLIGWLPGTYATERWLHTKFSADRDSGEWFRDSLELRQFMSVMGLITESDPETPTIEVECGSMAKKKNSAAVALGRLGGKKKVPKGFSTMDPELRAEAGRQGAAKRWAKKAGKKR